MYCLAVDTNGILRLIVRLLDKPIRVVLILFVLITIIYVGSLIAEIVHRYHMDVKASKVVDMIKKGDKPVEEIITNMKILNKQKELLFELVKHKNLSNEMRENLAVSILENYNLEQERVVKRTDLITKLGPVFGLLGTLTPLGPGIIALSTGDTQTLSQSLLVAFDTTVVGLICAAICTCISIVRKRWYAKDRIMLALVMEALVESENIRKK